MGAVVALSGCGSRNKFIPPPPPEVTVAHPTTDEVVDSIEFTGTTRATATVNLRARVNGYLEQIKFDDGQAVNEGDLLFVIEQAPFEVALASAKAALQKAHAALQLAEANHARTAELFQRKVVTQQEVDVQKANLAGAQADVAAAEAQVRQAELNLQYTEIRAPLNGRIGRHLIDKGNLIQAEQTQLAVIESIDPIQAYFNVSEPDLLRFMEMLRENKLPDPEKHPPVLYLQLGNETGFPHKGHLDYRELGVDPTTGTILRRAVFPNPDHALIPGLFARLRAPIGQPEPKLLVEERALGADQRGQYVLVVNDENVVEYRSVKTGIAVGDRRVIQDGIDKDDWIVVNGLQRARPGSKVSPQQQRGQGSEVGDQGNAKGRSVALAPDRHP